jgi:glutathione S-transferase
MPIALYHVDWCPECELARQKLADLGVAYEDIVVPNVRAFRKQVYAVSGQYYVPVLKDDGLVLTEIQDILAYLDDRYGKNGSGPDAAKKFASRSAGREPGSLGGEDQYPSCRR